eukprot:TRINITY_DN23671_c1_g1_i1.p1 TRINITY_DN23671_c1_g1~~TRINITY_DN23671_c1_g1_i1.p1  ORF type:complete len:504 (+),score=169.45 TRINITY_DN23671_c1_g1_i1:80-1513(+)
MWRAQPGTTIAGRYRVRQEAGRGSFARVVRCEDTTTGKSCAVKILDRRYARDAAREADVLRAVSRHDPDDKEPIVKMQGQFQWEGLPCMVFKLHGPSLRSRRFGTGDKNGLAQLAKQVGAALQYLHVTCRAVHTDLKPENILLRDPEEGNTSGLGTRFVVCDLGSASFYTERADNELITTRPYRAPEVLLCGGWGWAADNFSLGAILYEVHTGHTLFECARYSDSDDQHIQAMERRLGQVPSWLCDAAAGRGRGLVHQITAGRRYNNSPFSAADRSDSAPFTDKLGSDRELADLLMRLMDYCTHQRLRADEIPHHPFVAGRCGRTCAPLCRYPTSAYTAGRIASGPGGRSAPRPPANALRGEKTPQPPAAPRASEEPPRHGRSSSVRPAAAQKPPRLEALRDVTNRLPVLVTDKRADAVSAADSRQPLTARAHGHADTATYQRPRSGSVSASARTGRSGFETARGSRPAGLPSTRLW